MPESTKSDQVYARRAGRISEHQPESFARHDRPETAIRTWVAMNYFYIDRAIFMTSFAKAQKVVKHTAQSESRA